ncbi:MAG: hypothetical protein Q9168_005077 [Polycauliona sp. 1 TL-2023]
MVCGPTQPLPRVGQVNAGVESPYQETLESIIESLKLSGGCIVRNLISRETVQELNHDFAPYFTKAKPLKSMEHPLQPANDRSRRFLTGDFWATETRRITGCMGKSDAYALKVVGNDLWQDVGRHFLTSTLHWWIGDKQEHSTSKPQLNNTSVFKIRPGATAQALHRDDCICHVHHAAVPSHEMGRDYGIGLFVAGTRSRRQNGATRFIPGSHLWDYGDKPHEELAMYAELEAGDAFMMLSGCYHAGSANTTCDEERQLYSAFTGRGWCRQEENQYLANDVERVRRLPVQLQKFMGWELSLPFMGWVGLDAPLRLLRGEESKVCAYF